MSVTQWSETMQNNSTLDCETHGGTQLFNASWTTIIWIINNNNNNNNSNNNNNLTIIELTMWVCGNQLLYGWCHRHQNRMLCSRPHSHESVSFSYCGIHTFYATTTLLNIWICMQWTDAADGGCGGGFDFAPMHATRRPLLMTTCTQVWTLNPSNNNKTLTWSQHIWTILITLDYLRNHHDVTCCLICAYINRSVVAKDNMKTLEESLWYMQTPKHTTTLRKSCLFS